MGSPPQTRPVGDPLGGIQSWDPKSGGGNPPNWHRAPTPSSAAQACWGPDGGSPQIVTGLGLGNIPQLRVGVTPPFLPPERPSPRTASCKALRKRGGGPPPPPITMAPTQVGPNPPRNALGTTRNGPEPTEPQPGVSPTIPPTLTRPNPRRKPPPYMALASGTRNGPQGTPTLHGPSFGNPEIPCWHPEISKSKSLLRTASKKPANLSHPSRPSNATSGPQDGSNLTSSNSTPGPTRNSRRNPTLDPPSTTCNGARRATSGPTPANSSLPPGPHLQPFTLKMEPT